MKLLYAFTILWTFYTTAKGLDCQTCDDPQCVAETSLTCVTETMCVTATTQVNLGGLPNTIITKQCAPPSICPTVGPQTVTINAGLSNLETSAVCCNTDNCNAATLPAPTRNTTANDVLECNFCLPNTELCDIIVGCEGNELSCFQGTVTGGPLGDDILGCASTNLCDGAPSLGTQLFQTFGTITRGPTCCSTSFCNERLTGTETTPSPTSVTVGSTGSGSGVTSGSGGDGGSDGVTSGSGGDGGSDGVTSGSGGDGGSDGVTSGSGGDGGSDGVTSGSGGDGGSDGVTSGSGGDGGSDGVTSGSGGDGGSDGVTSGSGGDGGSDGVTSGSGGDGGSDGVTSGSGGDGGSDGVTSGPGGDGGSGVTTNSSPVLTCALTGPVGVIVMIFISTFG